jgi:CubicO group peptidase (beta-lactamase class C family)
MATDALAEDTEAENTAACEPAGDPPMTPQARLDALFAPFNKSDQPGLVVGVRLNGEIIYRRGFGLASIEHAVANTPATRMRIGSTSKHFTCLAALLLAEEGKLDLDAPVTDILPELPTLRGVPTLRQFMSHTGGYRCYVDIGVMACGTATQPVGQALAAQVRQTDVNFVPTEGQLYNNGGYHLLSIAIERASGMPFEAFMKARIYQPLGMLDTIAAPSDFDIIPGIATLHTPNPAGGWRRGIFVTEEIRGEGSMVSTIDDMLRWLAHMNGAKTIGSEASWNQLKTQAVLKDGTRTTYALGLFRNDYRGVEVIHHGGGVLGGTCAMLTVPDHGLDVVMIANGGPANVADLQYRIVDALLEDALSKPAATMATAEPFKHLDGANYHHPSGPFFGFKVVEDKLAVCLMGSPPMPILRDEGDVLRIAFEDIAMGPFVWKVADLAADAAGGAPEAIDMAETGRVLRFGKLPAKPPATLEAGAALVGRYRSVDLNADGTVTVEADKLLLAVQAQTGRTVYELEALSDIVFSARSAAIPGFALSVTVLPEGAGFHISGGRTRHILFSPVAG